MKKFAWLIALACMLAISTACALTPEEALDRVMSSLTEVYGYEQADADRFTAEVEDKDGIILVRYALQEHPEWVYTAEYHPHTERMENMQTPFKPDNGYVYYPGESAVRYGLTQARKNEWFENWEEYGCVSMMDYMVQWGMQRTGTMMEAAATGTLSRGMALHEFFVSAYGDPASWPQALTEWHDEEMASFGLTAEPAQTQDEKVVSYEVQPAYGSAVKVTRFKDEVPAELTQAMQEALEKGWTCLTGAYRLEGDGYGAGLAVLEKEGMRRLAKISRSENAPQWSIHPISDQAVPKGDLILNVDPQTWDFLLISKESTGESVRMELRTALYDREGVSISCRLQQYEHWDAQQKNGIIVEVRAGYALDAAQYTDGSVTERFYSDNPPICDLAVIGLKDFPVTLEACKTSGIDIPEGYGVSGGVHLRQKTSSHSKDLGHYKSGTLVKILGMEPGDPYDWCHVQIGRAEGYMSSNYVFCEEGLRSENPLATTSLPLAETAGEVKLKAAPGLLARNVETLPAGTRMHVMAECGSWLHVMLAGDEPTSMMDPEGTDGYVKASQIKSIERSAGLTW